MKYVLLALLCAIAACTTIYQYGNNDTASVTTTTMINGNSATIPLAGTP